MESETAASHSAAEDRAAFGIIAACGLLMIMIFLLDLAIPLGVAMGVPYIAVVLISLWSPHKGFTVLVAVIASVFTMAAFFFKPQVAEMWKVVFNRALALFAIWVTATLGLQRKMTEEKREKALLDRERALEEARVLRGLLPICSSCKRIRDDQGYWTQLEQYISAHSDADFTHGICPECIEKLYPEVYCRIISKSDTKHLQPNEKADAGGEQRTTFEEAERRRAMGPIDELKMEHQAVKMTLRVLETLCGKMEQHGEAVDVHHIDQLLEFFSVFVDQCHHGKEEELLFPALEAAGVAREGGPIGVMLEEHERGREYVREMKSMLSEYRAGAASGASGFIGEARGYIYLLNQHIDKEDNVLFPLAERQLSEAKKAELAGGFEKIEVDKIGVGRHEAFHKILDQLERAYLG